MQAEAGGEANGGSSGGWAKARRVATAQVRGSFVAHLFLATDAVDLFCSTLVYGLAVLYTPRGVATAQVRGSALHCDAASLSCAPRSWCQCVNSAVAAPAAHYPPRPPPVQLLELGITLHNIADGCCILRHHSRPFCKISNLVAHPLCRCRSCASRCTACWKRRGLRHCGLRQHSCAVCKISNPAVQSPGRCWSWASRCTAC